LAFRQHISLLLGKINFLLIGADEDQAGLFAAWPYVQHSVYYLLYYTVLPNTIELTVVTVKRKAEREALIA